MPTEVGVKPTQSRRSIYTALEDLDFHWSVQEVEEFDEMWRMGIPIDWIAANFGRTEEEVAILVLDRRLKGYIEPRAGGLHGKYHVGDE